MEVTQLTVMSFLILRFRSFKSVHPAGKVLAAQLCLSLCDPMDCSLPGSSVHGILQTRILQWVARSFSRGSFLTQALNPGLYIASRFFIISATRDATSCCIMAQMVPHLLHCKWPGLSESIRDVAESNRAGSYKAPTYPVILPAEIS